MKRLILPLVVLFALGFSCPFFSGLGGQVDELLPDPQVGLDTLGNYNAELTISFMGMVDGQTVESTDSYTQSVWPLLEAQFTTIETVDDTSQPLFILTGDVGEAHYDQVGHASACAVRWGPSAESSSTLRLAELLDPVGAARSAGRETVEGIQTRRYTFDEGSLNLPEDVQAEGEAWIAEEGGFVVKYSLQVIDTDSYSGEGRHGTQQIEYLLSEVNAHPEVVYPEDCEPVLTDIPAVDDATDIIRLPDLLDYYSNSSLDAILAFYVDLFESRGWVIASDLRQEGERAIYIFTQPDSEETSFVSVRLHGELMWVTISMVGPGMEESSTPETTPQPGSGEEPTLRVTFALGILLGMDESHPGFASYHMESYHRIPAWEGGSVVHYEDQMVADVQDENVHFNDRVVNPGGSTSISEAYLLGEEIYPVEGGMIQPEGASMSALAWVLWPLDPTVILGTAASGVQATGTETLGGRVAEVYAVDAAGSVGAIGGESLYVTAVSGTVWVDQETGALLKAELDYEADLKDEDGNVMGSGLGRFEIEVTLVNAVTVTLP